jgi:adenylate cyclase
MEKVLCAGFGKSKCQSCTVQWFVTASRQSTNRTSVTTVVFADLVGSTGIYESLGDADASHFITQLTSALSKIFTAQQGRVIKLLGDGLLVVFQHENDALAACAAIQQQLQDHPIYPGGNAQASAPVQIQMGLDAGDVVEIDGDCFGDAVNSAARLAELAGGAQILTTLRVYEALPSAQRRRVLSMGPLYLRGKSEATEVFRVQWRAGIDNEVTIMGAAKTVPVRTPRLRLQFKPTFATAVTAQQAVLMHHGMVMQQTIVLDTPQASAQLGRALQPSVNFSANQQLHIHDNRVSRLHCTIAWRGTHWIVSDASSYGTWVYIDGQPHPVALRRSECLLIGAGHISLGCERDADAAPLVRFELN